MITNLRQEEVFEVLNRFIVAFRNYIASKLDNLPGDNWEYFFNNVLRQEDQNRQDRKKQLRKDPKKLIDYPNLPTLERTYRNLLHNDFQQKIGGLNQMLRDIKDLRNDCHHHNPINKERLGTAFEHLKNISEKIGETSLLQRIDNLLKEDEIRMHSVTGLFEDESEQKEPYYNYKTAADNGPINLTIKEEYSLRGARESLEQKGVLPRFRSLVSELSEADELRNTGLLQKHGFDRGQQIPLKGLRQRFDVQDNNELVGVQHDANNQVRVRSHLLFLEVAYQENVVQEVVYLLPLYGNGANFSKTLNELTQTDMFGSEFFPLEVPIHLVGYL